MPENKTIEDLSEYFRRFNYGFPIYLSWKLPNYQVFAAKCVSYDKFDGLCLRYPNRHYEAPQCTFVPHVKTQPSWSTCLIVFHRHLLLTIGSTMDF